MATMGSFETSKTTYNNYTQSCIFSWNSTSNMETMEHTISWELTLKNGYATIHGASVSINGNNYSIGNVNVSASNNGQYSRKYIIKGTIVIPSGNDGNASLNVSATAHIAASNLNSTGNGIWALPQLLLPDEYLPIINSFTLSDVNTVTTELTNDNSKVIVGYSNVKATYNVSAQRGNTIKKVALVSGSKTVESTNASGTLTINAISDNVLSLVVTDSANHVRTQSITMSKVEYSKPTCVYEVARVSPTSEIANIKVSGLCFSGNFGNTNNQLYLKYRYKDVDYDTFSDWVVAELSMNNNRYDETVQVENLDYTVAYDVEFVVYDKLATSETFNGLVRIGFPDYWHNANEFVAYQDIYTFRHKVYERLYPFKILSGILTPSSTTTQILLRDDSLYNNYIVLGYAVWFNNEEYVWYGSTVDTIHFRSDGLYMKVNNQSVCDKPLIIVLMRLD